MQENVLKERASYRNFSIDFYRFIGISLIILAHCDIPWIIFQARNFDVPLMVFISGYCAVNFSSNSKNFNSYLKDRFLRLIVPTWIFLIFYFIIMPFFGVETTRTEIIQSFLMTGGPVGVWIIRIFFFMAIITPIILHLPKKYITARYLVILLLLNELIIFIIQIFPPCPLVDIFSTLFVYTFSYFCVLYIGIAWESLGGKTRLLLIGIFFIIFFNFLCFFYFKNGFLILTQAYKTPPSLYYLSYALFMSLFLFMFNNSLIIEGLSKNHIVAFIGTHSLWIYLWHWMYLYAYDALCNNDNFWGTKFSIIFSCAVFTTFTQVVIFNKVTSGLSKKPKDLLFKVFIG